jgi:hypothetical protein
MSCRSLLTRVALVVSCLWPGVAQSAELPAGWESLPAAEFLEVATQPDLSAEDREAAARRAAQLLDADGAIGEARDYGLLTELLRLAKPEMAPDEVFRLANKISAIKDAAGTLTYQQMRQKVALLYLAGAPLDRRAQEVAQWIEADQTGLRDVWEAELSWLYNTISEPHLRDGSFAVQWTGKLTAPRSGEYVLSLSPINVNAQWESFFIRQHCVISVDGRDVLRATPEDWKIDAAPIQLTAGKPVALSVAYDAEVSRHAVEAIHAMLFWRGPGISREVVPTSALSTSTGELGVDGTYSVKLASGAQTIRRVDPAIDFAWITDRRVVFAHDAAINKLRQVIWDKCMDPEFLAGCEESRSPRHRHPFLYDLLLVECLTTPQREAFLEELQNRPAMLERLTPAEAIRFFKAFRFGAEETALDVFGLWAQQHADLQSDLPPRPEPQAFFDVNRMEFHDLARCVYVQAPHQAKRLEEEYLVAEDGSCVIPVAYTLAYCYQDDGRIEEWRRLLDEMLADSEVSGDKRVNWLLVRAMIDELSAVDASFFTGSNEDLMAGWRWLGDAARAAQSPEAKVRALGELIAREAALGQFEGATRRVSESDAAVLAADPRSSGWQKQLADISKLAKSREEQAEAASVESYRREMRRRQQRAANRGDDAEAGRLQQLIGESTTER